MNNPRHAVVTGNEKTIQAYMPSNYTARRAGQFAPFDTRIVITGYDSAGWTLDDYVIPRLASGLYWALELDDTEYELLLDEAQANDEMTAEDLAGISPPDY